MSRNYQREERDWRRQQPSMQEEDQWSNNRSDDDFRMGLGQESRGSRGEDLARRGGSEYGRSEGREGLRRAPSRLGGSYRGRERDYGAEDYRSGSSDMDWDQNEDFQGGGSRWQRSQFRGAGSEFEGNPQRGRDRDNNWSSYNDRYEGLGGRGWYEGVQQAMHRGEGQFAGRGPRNYKRSDDRIQEDINEQLTRHGNIDATDIEVTVQNGEVTLRGGVDSRQAKRLAEDIADAVAGVKEVVNQIRIKQRGESGDRESKQEATETTGKQHRKAS